MPLTIEHLNTIEDDLVQEFRALNFFQKMMDVTQNDFLQALLQRRFLSLVFTPVYDLAIDCLIDEKAKRIARRILREEYPDSRGTVPSHREDLVDDLILLGATRDQIITSQPTAQTLETINKTFLLFSNKDKNETFFQITVLTILRFWGEVLVSVEYGELLKRMGKMGLKKTGASSSAFYYPHYIHDAKLKPLTSVAVGNATHADQLSSHLIALLDTEEAIEHCIKIEKQIIAIKSGFYQQFEHMLAS